MSTYTLRYRDYADFYQQHSLNIAGDSGYYGAQRRFHLPDEKYTSLQNIKIPFEKNNREGCIYTTKKYYRVQFVDNLMNCVINHNSLFVNPSVMYRSFVMTNNDESKLNYGEAISFSSKVMYANI